MTAPIENQNNNNGPGDQNNDNGSQTGNNNNQNNQQNTNPDPNDKSNWTKEQWQAEAERWKGHSRTWENRANSSEKDLKEFKEKHSTDEEKAIEKAKEEARAEERAKWAGTSVESAFRAANNGRFTNSQLEALLPGLNRSAFMGGNDEVDNAKVESYISAFAPTTNNNDNQQQNTNVHNQQHNANGVGNNNQQSSGKRGSLDEGAELYKNRPNKGRTF